MRNELPQARLSTDRIFFTVQGEGPLTGIPSIFVRLDTCNLHCKWGDTLCDAHYTSWTPSGELIGVRELLREIEGMMVDHQCWFVVITGGEPTLQPEVVHAIVSLVKDNNGHVTIETNGTRFIVDSMIDLVCLSPKLKGSTPVGTVFEKAHERNRWKPDIIRQWMEDDSIEGYFFKFVIDTEADIEEVTDLLMEVGQELEPEHVLFMPEGITADDLWSKGRWLVERCKELGVRFTPRIQIDLFGNKPGT